MNTFLSRFYVPGNRQSLEELFSEFAITIWVMVIRQAPGATRLAYALL